MSLHWRVLPAVALCVVSAVFGASPKSNLLTAEELFKPPSLGHPSLSPDGSYFGALIHDEDDKGGLLVTDLATLEPTPLHGNRTLDIFSYEWLDDKRLLFQVSKEKLYAWGLFAVAADNLDAPYVVNSFDVTEIIGVPRRRPGRVILWIQHSMEDTFHGAKDLIEIDATHPQHDVGQTLNSNDILTSYLPPEGHVATNWVTDQQGDLALCWTWAGGHSHILRYVRGGRWVAVPAQGTVMELDPDRRYLWVVTHEEKKGYSLQRLDMDTGNLEPPVLTDPDYNIAAGKLHFLPSGALAGVTYLKQQMTSVWFSKRYSAVQVSIDRQSPGTINTILASDPTQQKFLIEYSGANHPASYGVLNLKTKALNFMGGSAPWLKDRPLLPTKAVSYTTRDGLKLDAYLTVPPGVTSDHPAPMVVLPHGGPWVRDELEFDPEVQFLASRGYIVLQPQYRGSTGFSPAISKEHKYDFRTMHNDVTDATKSLVAGGLVDSRHVAIMGGSFGGFLAVTGATFEPGLYCCAITLCGVFDWDRHIKSKSDYSRPGEYEVLRDTLGGRSGRSDDLAALSPLAHADQIHIPLLIAHGTDDSIVDAAQSRRLAASLKKLGVPHETFFRKFEGHGFYSYKNRVEFYHRVEAFLAANLGGATLTAPKSK